MRGISEENHNNYKKAKAKCRKIIKEAKRTSFQELANTFNRYTPLSKLWNITKAFKGHRPTLNKATMIIYNDNTFTRPDDITEQFANYYHMISSTCPTPLTIDTTEITDTESYNLPLTIAELEDAINRTGNTSPGPDQIHYHFFKQLGTRAKHMLLQALNHTYITTGRISEISGSWTGICLVLMIFMLTPLQWKMSYPT